MKSTRALVGILLLFTAGTGWSDFRIGSPWAPSSVVNATGDICEDWGTVEVSLVSPVTAEMTGQKYLLDPGPCVATTVEAGSVSLTKTAYRSPIWEDGLDVLSVKVANQGVEEATPRIRVQCPEGVQLGESAGLAGGRAVLGLPLGVHPLPREERSWGWLGGAAPMREWATPVGECDPAFRHIMAGLGGVPIRYRFSVPPGEGRTVVVGLCESFQSDPERRPLRIRVEGTRELDINPLEAWGRHQPGCLEFEAQDLSLDGRIDVIVHTQETAVDQNPILNVLWVFAPEEDLDLREVLRGARSADAEYYVDCGGDGDQSFYQSDRVEYELHLQPREEETLTFLLSCPGGGSVPDLASSAWTPRSLEKAAADVWLGWFAGREPSVETLPDELTAPPTIPEVSPETSP